LVANTGVVTLGLTLLHSRNLTLSAKYEFEGASGYSAQTGDVSVRWQF